MSSNRTLIRIFVAFPSDVREERRRLYQVVKELNDVGGMADQLGCVLQVLDWWDVVPGMGRFEDIILEQLPLEQWDIFIGVLSTKTDRFYDFGTEEMFGLAYHAWQQTGRPHILLYRQTSATSSPDAIEPDQLAKFREFAAHDQHSALREFQTPHNFERQVRHDMIRLLPRLS